MTRNFGLEAAIGAGFRYASKPWSVQLDADLQFPPSQIHALVARAMRGDCDVVFGIRRQRRDSLPRRAASRVQHLIARRVLGIEIPDGASSFRVVRTSVARKIAALRLGTPYFIAAVPAVGARYASVGIAHAARRDGSSRFPLRRLVSHALDLFFGFSLRPFALLPWAAAGAALLTVLAASFGWTSPVALLAVQALGLAGLAVLGRYVMGLVRHASPLRYLVREANVAIAAGGPPLRETTTPSVHATTRHRQAMRTLLVLGAGEGQLPDLPRGAAPRRSHDRRRPEPQAFAAPEADEFLCVSTRDAAGVHRAVGERSIAGVTSPASDASALSVRALALAYGTPFCVSWAAARASVDKVAFRRVVDRLDLPRYGWVSGATLPRSRRGRGR